MSVVRRDSSPSTPPSSVGRTTSTPFAYRAVAIVQEVMEGAARRNEATLARVRIVVCLLFLAREFGLFAHQVFAGHPKELLITTTTILVLVPSILHLAFPPRGSVSRRALAFSALELASFFVVLLAVVGWPEPDYAGVLRTPYVSLGTLVCCAAGLRVRRKLARAVGAIVVLGVVGVIVLDRSLGRAGVSSSASEAAYWLALLLGTALFGIAAAGRLREDVTRSAEKAIEAERARDRLGSYVGRAVAEQALLVDDLVLGGVRQPVAVLFSDLRGFTAYAEHTAPEDIVDQLNAYLEEMVRVITQHGGVVDKYMGDGIMAVFGAPWPSQRDAAQALCAASAMLEALEQHNERRAERGLAPLRMGIGIHCGDAIAGNVGTPEHAQYTIIGDVVNLAARLESATKDHEVSLLVSREVRDAASRDPEAARIALRPVGTLPIRGRSRSVEAFTLA